MKHASPDESKPDAIGSAAAAVSPYAIQKQLFDKLTDVKSDNEAVRLLQEAMTDPNFVFDSNFKSSENKSHHWLHLAVFKKWPAFVKKLLELESRNEISPIKRALVDINSDTPLDSILFKFYSSHQGLFEIQCAIEHGQNPSSPFDQKKLLDIPEPDQLSILLGKSNDDIKSLTEIKQLLEDAGFVAHRQVLSLILQKDKDETQIIAELDVLFKEFDSKGLRFNVFKNYMEFNDNSTLQHAIVIRNFVELAQKFNDRFTKDGLIWTTINSQADTPLHIAVVGNNVSMVEFLLSQGADPSLRNLSGMSPFMSAVIDGDLALADKLYHAYMSRSPTPSEEDENVFLNGINTLGLTALHTASMLGRPEAVEKLLVMGASQEILCTQDVTPLMAAIILTTALGRDELNEKNKAESAVGSAGLVEVLRQAAVKNKDHWKLPDKSVYLKITHILLNDSPYLSTVNDKQQNFIKVAIEFFAVDVLTEAFTINRLKPYLAQYKDLMLEFAEQQYKSLAANDKVPKETFQRIKRDFKSIRGLFNSLEPITPTTVLSMPYSPHLENTYAHMLLAYLKEKNTETIMGAIDAIEARGLIHVQEQRVINSLLHNPTIFQELKRLKLDVHLGFFMGFPLYDAAVKTPAAAHARTQPVAKNTVIDKSQAQSPEKSSASASTSFKSVDREWKVPDLFSSMNTVFRGINTHDPQNPLVSLLNTVTHYRTRSQEDLNIVFTVSNMLQIIQQTPNEDAASTVFDKYLQNHPLIVKELSKPLHHNKTPLEVIKGKGYQKLYEKVKTVINDYASQAVLFDQLRHANSEGDAVRILHQTLDSPSFTFDSNFRYVDWHLKNWLHFAVGKYWSTLVETLLAFEAQGRIVRIQRGIVNCNSDTPLDVLLGKMFNISVKLQEKELSTKAMTEASSKSSADYPKQSSRDTKEDAENLRENLSKAQALRNILADAGFIAHRQALNIIRCADSEEWALQQLTELMHNFRDQKFSFNINRVYSEFGHGSAIQHVIAIKNYIKLAMWIDDYFGSVAINWEIGNEATQETPLHMAAARGNLPMVEFLLAKGVNPAQPDHEGKNPLMAAVVDGHIDVVKILIDAYTTRWKNLSRFQILVNHSCHKGLTALHYATQFCHTEFVTALCELGASLEAQDSVSGDTPVMYAIALSTSHGQSVVDENAKENLASESQYLDLLDVFLQNAPKFTTTNKKGDNFIRYAIRYYAIEALKRIVKSERLKPYLMQHRQELLEFFERSCVAYAPEKLSAKEIRNQQKIIERILQSIEPLNSDRTNIELSLPEEQAKTYVDELTKCLKPFDKQKILKILDAIHMRGMIYLNERKEIERWFENDAIHYEIKKNQLESQLIEVCEFPLYALPGENTSAAATLGLEELKKLDLLQQDQFGNNWLHQTIDSIETLLSKINPTIKENPEFVKALEQANNLGLTPREYAYEKLPLSYLKSEVSLDELYQILALLGHNKQLHRYDLITPLCEYLSECQDAASKDKGERLIKTVFAMQSATDLVDQAEDKLQAAVLWALKANSWPIVDLLVESGASLVGGRKILDYLINHYHLDKSEVSTTIASKKSSPKKSKKQAKQKIKKTVKEDHHKHIEALFEAVCVQSPSLIDFSLCCAVIDKDHIALFKLLYQHKEGIFLLKDDQNHSVVVKATLMGSHKILDWIIQHHPKALKSHKKKDKIDLLALAKSYQEHAQNPGAISKCISLLEHYKEQKSGAAAASAAASAVVDANSEALISKDTAAEEVLLDFVQQHLPSQSEKPAKVKVKSPSSSTKQAVSADTQSRPASQQANGSIGAQSKKIASASAQRRPVSQQANGSIGTQSKKVVSVSAQRRPASRQVNSANGAQTNQVASARVQRRPASRQVNSANGAQTNQAASARVQRHPSSRQVNSFNGAKASQTAKEVSVEASNGEAGSAFAYRPDLFPKLPATSAKSNDQADIGLGPAYELPIATAGLDDAAASAESISSNASVNLPVENARTPIASPQPTAEPVVTSAPAPELLTIFSITAAAETTFYVPNQPQAGLPPVPPNWQWQANQRCALRHRLEAGGALMYPILPGIDRGQNSYIYLVVEGSQQQPYFTLCSAHNQRLPQEGVSFIPVNDVTGEIFALLFLSGQYFPLPLGDNFWQKPIPTPYAFLQSPMSAPNYVSMRPPQQMRPPMSPSRPPQQMRPPMSPSRPSQQQAVLQVRPPMSPMRSPQQQAALQVRPPMSPMRSPQQQAVLQVRPLYDPRVFAQQQQMFHQSEFPVLRPPK